MLTSLDRYRVESVLGNGGMGIVYRGTDTILQRPVAIKVLTRHAPGRSLPDQALEEARRASALNHPNICTVFEVVDSDEQPCIVMELLDGQPLSKIIPPETGLPVPQIAAYGAQIADAIAHAHERGIVHRDLKCANVIITAEQRVKVLDFGLSVEVAAKSMDEDTSSLSDISSDSQGRRTPGTLLYMAPEILRGGSADQRTDIWALGVVLYEMAAGERPFRGGTPYEISAAILEHATPPLPSRLPASLRAIITRCLSKEPSQRYRSAAEVRAALEALDVDLRLGRGRETVWRRAGTLAGLAVLAVAVFAAAEGIRSLLRSRNQASVTSKDVVLPNEEIRDKYLAVIPVIAGEASNNTESLTESVAERLINRLTAIHIAGLQVIALPTALQYKRAPGDLLSRVHDELHAQFVVTINVATEGQRLTIGASLEKTEDKSHVWGRAYEGSLRRDLLTIQAEMAMQVASSLAQQLAVDVPVGSEERATLTAESTKSSEAFVLYSQGQHYWFTPTATAAEYAKSLEYYQRAIVIDPNYARARIGIANTLLSMAWEGWIPPLKARDDAARALAHATKLNPNVGEAHYTRASLLLFDGDWDGAEPEYLAGIAAAPAFVANRRYYALELLTRGRSKQALEVISETLRIDPRGISSNLALATTYYWSNQSQQAITQLKKTLDIDPDGPATAAVREILADVYESTGQYPAAITERERALRLNGAPEVADALRRDYAKSGFAVAMHHFYERQLDVVNALSLSTYVSPMTFAVLHIHLGDVDEAFDWLERAHAERAPWLIYLRCDPLFAPLRDDPRFDRLIREVGIPAS